MSDRVTPGQKLIASPFRTARVINGVMEMWDEFRGGQYGIEGGTSRNAQGVLLVKNKTGGSVLAGDCLQLGTSLVSPLNAHCLSLEADFPEVPLDRRLVIAREAMVTNDIRPAQAAGVCIARVDVLDTDHTHATPVASTGVMDSASSGPFELMQVPTGTGVQQIVVRFNSTTSQILLGKTNASHAKGASGTINLYSGTKGSETATGETATAWNRFVDLDSGKWVLLAWVGNGYDLIAGEC